MAEIDNDFHYHFIFSYKVSYLQLVRCISYKSINYWFFQPLINIINHLLTYLTFIAPIHFFTLTNYYH